MRPYESIQTQRRLRNNSKSNARTNCTSQLRRSFNRSKPWTTPRLSRCGQLGSTIQESANYRTRRISLYECAEVVINGVPAYTLFDSGCTTDSISPTLAFVTKADCIELSEQMNLQLGAKGSRTKINHGAKANMKIGTVDEDHYFDVVDIDRYDVILGTPFFLEHNVTLDFGNRTITIDGHEVPVYTRIDEATLLTNRKTKTRTKVGKELQAALAEHINKD